MDGTNESVGFSIWAVDNVVYGPVDLPTLIGWLQEERITAETWIHHGDKNTWHKANQLTELNSFFSNATPSGGTAFTSRLAPAGIKPGSLRRVKILAGMTDEQLTRFVGYMEVQTARQFSEVVKQGSPGDAMYLVLDGELRVRLMIAGKETILATLPAGEFFGEISLFDHGPRSADVIANVDAQLLKISASAFKRLLDDAPDLAAPFLFAIGKTLTARIRADNKRLRESVTLARAAGH